MPLARQWQWFKHLNAILSPESAWEELDLAIARSWFSFKLIDMYTSGPGPHILYLHVGDSQWLEAAPAPPMPPHWEPLHPQSAGAGLAGHMATTNSK